ncbi:hypothetical protein HKX48_002725, partial [Thoreauomyces humboldtii]
MRLLHHPNITRLFDVVETEHQIVLTMEHVEGGELFDYIVAQKRLKDRVARRLFRQIISALEYCHRSSIIHRDLKPENLLLDNEKNIKIIDFGFVKLFDRHESLQTFCGSPFYASPGESVSHSSLSEVLDGQDVLMQVCSIILLEMILGRQYQGPEVDIWSMGVILFALLNGHLPFTDTNTTELYKKIANGIYETRTQYMSPDSADLIKRMLTVDPNERATIAEIRNHRWVLQDTPEPPVSHVPRRLECLVAPDPNILAKFPMYGMDLQQAEKSLSNSENGPAWGLYHLLAEHEAWEAMAASGEIANPAGSTTAIASTHTTPERPTGVRPASLPTPLNKRNMNRLSLGLKIGVPITADAVRGPSTPGPVPTANPFDLPPTVTTTRRRRSMVEANAEAIAAIRRRGEGQTGTPDSSAPTSPGATSPGVSEHGASKSLPREYTPTTPGPTPPTPTTVTASRQTESSHTSLGPAESTSTPATMMNPRRRASLARIEGTISRQSTMSRPETLRANHHEQQHQQQQQQPSSPTTPTGGKQRFPIDEPP